MAIRPYVGPPEATDRDAPTEHFRPAVEDRTWCVHRHASITTPNRGWRPVRSTEDRLLARPIVAVEGPDDAAETYERFEPYLSELETAPLVVQVVDRSGGLLEDEADPDGTTIDQREGRAREALEAFERRATIDGVDVETRILYGSDVVGTLVETAIEEDATAVVFAATEGGLRELLTGGVRSSLVTDVEVPVVALPRR